MFAPAISIEKAKLLPRFKKKKTSFFEKNSFTVNLDGTAINLRFMSELYFLLCRCVFVRHINPFSETSVEISHLVDFEHNFNSF